MLGIFVIIGVTLYFFSRKKKYIIYIAICGILILFTQTRSAIYGLLPSILLAYYIIARFNVKKILIYLTILVFFLISYNTIYDTILEFSPRSKLEIGANTYAKLSANIYGSYAVLRTNPLIGVARNKQNSAIDLSAKELGEVIQTKRSFGTYYTYHNIFGFYIRNYGLIGLSLFIVLIYKILRKIQYKQNIYIKFLLLASIIFFIQFNMLHTNSLLYSIHIWVLLSLGNEQINGNSPVSNHRY